MTKYRLVERIHGTASEFLIQKRFLGFLFWYYVITPLPEKQIEEE